MNTKPGHTASTRRRAREDGSIELTTSKGDVVIVDADIADLLPKGFLHLSKRSKGKGYARIELGRHIKRENVVIHRFVMGLLAGDGQIVDHINGNKLDNRRANLRLVTPSVNALNRRSASSNAVGFLGVRRDPRRISNPYRAELILDRKRIHIGCFATAEEAHAAYMRAKEPLIAPAREQA